MQKFARASVRTRTFGRRYLRIRWKSQDSVPQRLRRRWRSQHRDGISLLRRHVPPRGAQRCVTFYMYVCKEDWIDVFVAGTFRFRISVWLSSKLVLSMSDWKVTKGLFLAWMWTAHISMVRNLIGSPVYPAVVSKSSFVGLQMGVRWQLQFS